MTSAAENPTLEGLYAEVTAAILRAETANALGDESGAADAHFDVSCIEEEIAAVVPPDDPEGAIARRGVLRAALRAGQYARVDELADQYLRDPRTEGSLRAALAGFQAQAREALNEAVAHDVPVVPGARFHLKAA